MPFGALDRLATACEALTESLDGNPLPKLRGCERTLVIVFAGESTGVRLRDLERAQRDRSASAPDEVNRFRTAQARP